MDTPQNEQQTQTPKDEQQHFYFLISGEVEYIERQQPPQKGHRPKLPNPNPQHLKVNTVFQSPLQGLTAVQLGKCQVNLQMNFHNRYSRKYKMPPEITYCTILHISFLGMFSEKEFLDNAPTQSGPDVLEELATKETPPATGS